MALITCPECGGQVSDSAVTCPHCGYSLANLKRCGECGSIISEKDASCPECGQPTPWSRKCPECGNHVLASEENCPECGFDMVSHYGRSNTLSSPIATEDTQTISYDWEEVEEKTSNKKWYVTGSIIVVIAVSLVWWFMGRGNNPTMKCEIVNNKGQIFGVNNKPICAAEMYSDNEPFHITFNSSVDMFGRSVTEVYLRGGQAYNEYPYSSQLEALTPLADYEAIKKDGAWIFTFSKIKPIAEKDIPIERKLHAAKTKEEVEKLINGTTWHCTENLSTTGMSGWIQVKFDNGHYICYCASPSDGRWTETGRGTYTIGEGRFDNTGEYFVSIDWECPYISKYFSQLPCQFRFFPTNGQIDVRCHALDVANKSMSGNWYRPNTVESSKMAHGEYKWN